MGAFTNKICADSLYEVAVAESVGDVTFFCGASIDRKWNSAILQRTKIANNFETIAFTYETHKDN
jgi:hypothetical protein